LTPGKRDVSPISRGSAVFDRLDRKTCAVPSERRGSAVENPKSWAQWDKANNHGFSQEDIWHEMRAIGGDERQAIRSLIEADKRLDD